MTTFPQVNGTGCMHCLWVGYCCCCFQPLTTP
uniref:Uncharacterized protein n=1 Tax=Anguilla anguilla TaxID=7936 RepID=A0A0E9RRP8_ANGAN